MENLIKQILEIDRQARMETEQAEQRRSAVEQEVQKKKQDMRQEYITRAEKRIDLLAQKEDEMAHSAIDQANQAAAAQIERLEQHYQQHKEEWVEQLTARVTGGIG